MADSFSRYDVYAVAGSRYCYRDTGVLKNRFGLRDAGQLKSRKSRLIFPPTGTVSRIQAGFLICGQ